MGRRIVPVDPEHIVAIVSGVAVTSLGLNPDGLKLVRFWSDQGIAPNGIIYLLLEHPAWPESIEGAPYQVLYPRLTMVAPEADDADQS